MTIGIVPDEFDGAERLVDAVESTGRAVSSGRATTVCAADPEFVVSCGDDALSSLVDADCRVPVLPVGTDRGVQSVPLDRSTAAVESALAGEATVVEHAVLGVSDGDWYETAIFDVTLLTSDPAHISEFEVLVREEPVARFRADGVVVATPAGSHGYSRAAGGPLVAPGGSVVSVVPISAFLTRHVHWVLEMNAVGLRVVRDESRVSLFVDGRERREVVSDSHVELSSDGTLRCLVVPESPSFFDGPSSGDG